MLTVAANFQEHPPMHDILMSLILGVVEGVTEFLPISSTAHLLVTERLLGLGDEWEAFTVVIQFGAVLAVVFLGERFHPYHAIGIALIAAGIVLASVTRGRHLSPP